MDDLKYQIALSLIPGIGCLMTRNLFAYFGSGESIFKASEAVLQKVPGIGKVLSSNIKNADVLDRASREMEFADKYHIDILSINDDRYPIRLKQCTDAPIILFSKGNISFESGRMVGIVGTRNSTDKGRKFCNSMVEAMAAHGGFCVVSGLAYGIDVAAHRACLQHNVPTIGVLGHGLDRIYPGEHRSIAEKMLKNGGLVSDFASGTEIERGNFIQRNRIIAGLIDALVVVESANKGGALVTADLANSYDRDVFAVPGRPDDKYSQGCNRLIKNNQAALIDCLEDLEYFMSWQSDDRPVVSQPKLFTDLSDIEQKIVDTIGVNSLSVDEICEKAGISIGQLSSVLLELEFKDVITALPGRRYRMS